MKIVITHGSLGKPHENWIPWLENELDKLNLEYLTPTFPTPNHQNYNDWEKVLNMYHDFGCFGDDTIFIGHSCGSIFLAKYIVKNRLKCRCLISASGYNNFYSNNELMDGLNSTFYMDDAELKYITELSENRIAIYSDNDPFIPQSKLNEFSELIKAEKYVVHNGGHLNSSAGFLNFELLLKLIKKQI